jgi:hypothetical protein
MAAREGAMEEVWQEPEAEERQPVDELRYKFRREPDRSEMPGHQLEHG